MTGQRPSLVDYLAAPLLKRISRQRLLGGPSLRVCDYLNLCRFLSETGAILGQAKSDRRVFLGEFCGEPGRGAEAIAVQERQAGERLEKFETKVGRKPRTFHEYVVWQELDRGWVALFPDSPSSDVSLTRVLCGDEGERIRLRKYIDDKRYLSQMKKVLQMEFPVRDLAANIEASGLQGMGFGCRFPELTLDMYHEENERTDVDSWAEARSLGINILNRPPVKPFKRQEEMVLSMVAAYATKYRPELVEPLGLLPPREESPKKAQVELDVLPPIEDDSEDAQVEANTGETTWVYCTRCGSRTDGGANFCENCGASIAKAVPPSTPPRPPGTPKAPSQPQKLETRDMSKGERPRVPCSTCGRVLPEGTEFCEECGTRVGKGVPPTVVGAPAPVSRLSPAAIATIVVLVIVALLSIASAFTGNIDEDGTFSWVRFLMECVVAIPLMLLTYGVAQGLHRLVTGRWMNLRGHSGRQ